MGNEESPNFGPGPKILWIMMFKRTEATSPYEVEFYIPAPIGDKQWMKVNQEMESEALNFLEKIQTLCEKLKEECSTPSEEGDNENYLNKAKDVTHKLENLEELIKRFNDIMHRLNKPPPSE